MARKIKIGLALITIALIEFVFNYCLYVLIIGRQ